MNKTISIRLTEERADLLNRAKKYHRVKKDIDVIDLALRESLKTETDYDSKLKSVSGCIKLTGNEVPRGKSRGIKGKTTAQKPSRSKPRGIDPRGNENATHTIRGSKRWK